jgi:hypothetical protein
MKQEPRQLTDEEILAAPTSSLSLEQIQRRIMVSQLRKAEREVDLVEEENRKHEDAKVEKSRVAAAKTRIIEEAAEKTRREQSICQHKSGGKNLAGFFNGDGKMGYTICTQQLPTGVIYMMCMRCQKEWWLPKKRDVLNGTLTLKQYRAQESEYYRVMALDKQLFEGEGGVPASCQFRIPALESARLRDDSEFEVYLAANPGADALAG